MFSTRLSGWDKNKKISVQVMLLQLLKMSWPWPFSDKTSIADKKYKNNYIFTQFSCEKTKSDKNCFLLFLRRHKNVNWIFNPHEAKNRRSGCWAAKSPNLTIIPRENFTLIITFLIWNMFSSLESYFYFFFNFFCSAEQRSLNQLILWEFLLFFLLFVCGWVEGENSNRNCFSLDGDDE